jgi:hypothetical protein
VECLFKQKGLEIVDTALREQGRGKIMGKMALSQNSLSPESKASTNEAHTENK